MMTSSVPPVRWNVPYKQNPFFTGREELLNSLHDALHAENAVALSHPQGISGLGGIGKTQTAIEYAYRCREEYGVVLWVRADSSSTLTSSYVDLAHLLDVPERDEQDQNVVVEAVLSWLRLHTGWLLIFDNVDDLSVAKRFLPIAGPGHILFTTRAHALGGVAQPLEVPKMEPETGALLLLRRASFLSLQATLDMAKTDDQRMARAISQELDGLPLALDQAGAYIKEAPCPLPEYLPRYQTRRSDLLQERGKFNQGYPASVATTWSLSFEKVSQGNPAAAELLDFCAFLSPDAIPEEMIIKGAQHLTPLLQTVTTNPVQFDQTIASLLNYSLIARNNNEMLNIHRLVQIVLKDTMDKATHIHWMQRAVRVVDGAFPEVEFKVWLQCERCLPHALICADFVEQEGMTLPEAASLFYRAGWYLFDRAQYIEAEPLFLRSLAIWEQQSEPQHPSAAYPLTGLATLYSLQGKHAEAEPLYQRALTIWGQRSEPDHPHVTAPLTGLANLYFDQGKYAEAEPLYRRAVRILEQQLGPEHPDVASPLTGLANVYTEQGKYAEAEFLYQQALTIFEQQLGPEHPQVAYPLYGLAILCKKQGKYAEAEPLYQRALHIWEQQLGPEHPDVAFSLNGLAELYTEQGKYAEAEPLCRRALQIWEQQLGPEHPNMAYVLNSLAKLYAEQGKYTEAESLYQRALYIREQALGPEHPETAEIMYDLAQFRETQGNSEEAKIWYARALAVREQTIGTRDPKTIETRKCLIALLRIMGQHEEAARLEAVQSELGEGDNMS